MKKLMTLLALLGILAVVVAGCVAPPPAPAAEAPAPTEAATEETAPEAPAEGETIKIGGIHPLTGGLAADGTQMDNAIRMAIDELNAAGGVLDGRMFAYLSADSTGSAEVGQTEAERLANEGAAALICCFQSAVTANVAALAERGCTAGDRRGRGRRHPGPGLYLHLPSPAQCYQYG